VRSREAGSITRTFSPGAFVERDENWDFTVPSASLSAETAPCEGAILEFINQSAEGARRRR